MKERPELSLFRSDPSFMISPHTNRYCNLLGAKCIATDQLHSGREIWQVLNTKKQNPNFSVSYKNKQQKKVASFPCFASTSFCLFFPHTRAIVTQLLRSVEDFIIV